MEEGEGLDVSEGVEEEGLSSDEFDVCGGLSFEGLEELAEESEIADSVGASEVEEAFLADSAELSQLITREIEEYDKSIEGINELFDPFDWGSPYNKNCGSCAVACEMRLSGQDPEAVADARAILSIREMNEMTGKVQTPMTPQEIIAFAKQQGPGYHGIVGFDWKGENEGHWINVGVSPSGRVYALDAQCGQTVLFDEYVKSYAKAGINWDLSR
ncbi:toxin glutamine deamidase domain-containing protein [Gordonibacter sp.]|uniref:toxin glutamine deamidase domain-containing protein n=1 Tax=Gordonibacter sp. TaxID=1968902 RepID=UPI001F92F349|nr:toxin glutamine deamidase domain-containing protein [Gordonibacter sp.]HIW75917.1 hypothetical protein [Candidatus Gordonibacter avicola]